MAILGNLLTKQPEQYKQLYWRILYKVTFLFCI